MFSNKLSVCRARSPVAKGMGFTLSRKSCWVAVRESVIEVNKGV